MARVPSTLIHSRFPGCGRRVWSEGAIYYGVSGVYINGTTSMVVSALPQRLDRTGIS